MKTLKVIGFFIASYVLLNFIVMTLFSFMGLETKIGEYRSLLMLIDILIAIFITWSFFHHNWSGNTDNPQLQEEETTHLMPDTIKPQMIQQIINRANELKKTIINEDYSNDFSISNTKKIMISEKTFNEIKETTIELRRLLKNICNTEDFIARMRRMSKTNANVNSYLFNLTSLLVKDILKCYLKMGYSQKTSFKTPQGQCLYVITKICCDENETFGFSYVDLIGDMEFDDTSKKFISFTNRQLTIFSSMTTSAEHIDGHDDFNLSLLFAVHDDELEEIYRILMFRLNQIIAKTDGKLSEKEKDWLKNILKNEEWIKSDDEEDTESNTQTRIEWIAKSEANIDAIKRTTKKSVEKEKGVPIAENKTSFDELDELIGLSETKKEIASLTNYIQMKQKRDEMGLKSPNVSYHCVFSGPPGTGKTTVARVLAGIYRDLGVLKKGHLVETDRSGLVAEYVGQTAVKTNKIIDEALDGVLFIDEAYTLAQESKEDYGREAIATLLKRMEDDRDRLVVILAGYTNEIEHFINSNPGFRSRFNRYIYFDNYTADELYEIFSLQLKKNEYMLADDATQYLKEHLESITQNRPKDFGNARYVRNLFEKTVESQASRLSLVPNLTKETLSKICIEDIVNSLSDQAHTGTVKS